MRILTMLGLCAASALTFVPAPVGAQEHVIDLPSLSIEGSALQSTVTYDAARKVYRYEYTVVAALTNNAPILDFSIDISGRVARPQLDPDLQNNVERKEAQRGALQPPTTIPVGIIVPDPANSNVGIGMAGNFWVGPRPAAWDVHPGTSRGGFILESKFPPGVRVAELTPSTISWIDIMRGSPRDAEFSPASAEKYDLKVQVVGPSDPDLAALFNGGGQSPANVNPFLRYGSPAQTRTRLAAGTTKFWVIVHYGATTNVSTFTATLDGADVRSLFTPIAGSAQAIQIPLHQGSNKLKLSIEGTTDSGRTAKDTDTLTFLVD